MTSPSPRQILACVSLSIAASMACAKPAPPALPPITIAAPPDVKTKSAMTLAASADTNPDSNGRPSPVVIRVYQLKTDAAFKGAEFFALYDDDQKVLGPELITRDEFVLAPSEKKTIDVAVSKDTRFVGAVAAFRDIRNAQWRGLVAAPQRSSLHVTVERARIVLSVVED
jgi:type VI secretion system protein VasD